MLLVSYIDWIGAALVSLLLLVAVFYVYINDLLSLYNRWTAMRRARRAKAEQIRLEQEEDRERVRRAMAESEMDDSDSKDAASVADIHNPAADIEAMSVGFDEYSDEEREDEYAIPRNEPLADASVKLQTEAISEVPTEAETTAETRITYEPAPVIAEVPASDLTRINDVAMPQSEANDCKEPLMSAPAVSPTETSAPALEVVSNKIEVGRGDTPQVYDPTAELSRYKRPGLDLLRDVPVKANSVDLEEQEENKERITKTLNDYGIAISHIQATVGPTVTLYEIIPAEGVRIAKIKRLEDDIAMTLAALGIRIIAPIPGKGTIGIEVPNKDPQTVSIRSILGSRKFQECKYQLPMAMGATIANEVYIADLCKMPHLLVAGATGMGKSVGLNTI
ncbi:MAG: hypothetical protein K2H14_05420, partial [Muribaculaceae bacterium]|nr:hypothetical protein [Muribaculaceae bacterium]